MNNNINEIILSVADNFRVGCASIGLIMTEARGKSPAQQMNDIRTEISLSEALIVELTAKIFDYEARILAATEKQISAKAKAVDAKAKAAEKIRQILEKIAPLEAQYAELEPRQDEAVLSETAKAYCIKKIKSKMHPHRSPELRTKEIRKGKEVEAKAIEFLESVFGEMELGYGFLTDTKTYTSDGFVHGECDIWLKDKKIVLDTKCSYDISTFPFFDAEIPEAAYAWQMQGYAAILGAEKMQVVYVLMNTPIDILEESARFQLGKDFSQEAWEAYVAYHTYDHLPPNQRIKIFRFERDEQKIAAIYKRVEECRAFIRSLAAKKYKL
ncbi:MAG: hypothetical protein U5L45_00360 [Saprospiraceae bacterium]|nr:hypothetical protein [Saprospiraceae bacterium]